MKTTHEIRRHLALLKDQAKARAARWGYATDASMPDGWGLTKYDCGLILTSLGQFLGYRVYGIAKGDITEFPPIGCALLSALSFLFSAPQSITSAPHVLWRKI